MLLALEIGGFMIEEEANVCWPHPKDPAWVALVSEAGSTVLHASEMCVFVVEELAIRFALKEVCIFRLTSEVLAWVDVLVAEHGDES